MTGMGEDGAAGLGTLQAAGAITAAQSPDTCVVDSMPRAAIERGFVSKVVTLPNMASFLQATCSTDRTHIEPTTANSSARNNAGEPSTSRR
jgi:two-component system chemotaxis response regulator CheB